MSRFYVYAVCGEAPDPAADGLTGISGSAVEVLPCADLLAVVSEVPTEEFSAERLEESMQDLQWLAATARAHHDVVDGVGRHTAVAPLSLATVFDDRTRVQQAIEARRDGLAAVLDRVRGRAEWGIKVFRPEAPSRPAEQKQERPASGSEYLRRRKAAVDAARRRSDGAEEEATTLYDELATVSVDARRHRVHDSSLTGRSEPMVLNAAFLVDDADSATWRSTVERVAPTGFLVEVTGPWVPYSFAAVPEPEVDR
ncbi:GvpL/GvpF family gas vesicle protein [Pseudonocardia nantongensis]|uniref:GvpL/GvpF family gas vesicle protein n=1 Tax=Pseudonocardia nantongensis TaxID=1181885 RepID=UPI003978F2AC